MLQTLQCPGGAAKLDCYPSPSGQAAPAVIICPGGGYSILSDRESGPVAAMFLSCNINAFVLRYTIDPAPLGTRPLLDLSWAVAQVRLHAAEFLVNPNQIAVCGFSAGGHLAGSLGVFWDSDRFFPNSAYQASHKPNALILGYPVITSGKYAHRGSFDRLFTTEEDQNIFSLENQVTKRVPPTFLWHTVQDRDVPVQNSTLFLHALVSHSVPCEMHLFQNGLHGLSLATEEVAEPEQGRFADPHVAHWSSLCVEWLKETFHCKQK